MTTSQEPHHRNATNSHSIDRSTSAYRWEIGFFLCASTLLVIQVLLFYHDINSLANGRVAVAVYAAVESFVVRRLAYLTMPAIYIPLFCLLFCARPPAWTRLYLDNFGGYIIFRMITQLIGLNILLFDFTTSRFLLITQLIFFLPYALLLWGWIYWRLDSFARLRGRPQFRLDCDREIPRPVDYFVASFSSVFSASISAIKGNSARARMLIIIHGIVIYDVMVLTLSRALALVQSRP